MSKYVFCNFPTTGQIHPTLAIVQELIARGEQVTYFTTDAFRPMLEHLGATVRLYDPALFPPSDPRGTSAQADDHRLMLLPLRLLRHSPSVVAQLLPQIEAEHPTCVVYSGLLIWARIIAVALAVPGVALWPTYAPSSRFGSFLTKQPPNELEASLWQGVQEAFTTLHTTYRLPFPDIPTLLRGTEPLVLVFLPRSFQPNAEDIEERFRFVGPSFRLDRDAGQPLPWERLGPAPRLYISLGTLYTDQMAFYQTCLQTFGGTSWQVVLSIGEQADLSSFSPIPDNILVARHVPQLAVLPYMGVFLSHGGMNSTMESLTLGVPLVIFPHTHEQRRTAQRVAALDLGVALDQTDLTVDALRAAVTHVYEHPQYREHVHTIQQEIQAAGGYLRATDLLQAYVAVQTRGTMKLP